MKTAFAILQFIKLTVAVIYYNWQLHHGGVAERIWSARSFNGEISEMLKAGLIWDYVTEIAKFLNNEHTASLPPLSSSIPRENACVGTYYLQ